ncbi:hypothetical protein EYZ11_001630 [Aspergillus tanneri]|uniref:Uncharacterized protein n=1 Tax=Aspergillus tanneri TaxID=1220188 RepID=A0A4S3JTX0_9EURO|nr:uncharacterized protein ATNIH1004_006088 [Aspergillus tanneri]KAA8647395.1 hypothetical protein ATNIH1004_006088 [Aspergillus tanneri]THC98917.1 hypothetical protein EYZ11_001630 [Aspergillus tanneri]
MTVFIVSLFLPYTINFQATELKRCKSSASHSHADDQTIGRLAEAYRRRRSKDYSQLSLTPGAITQDETIFKPYVSNSAGEIPSTDEPNSPGPSEPRAVSWGQSYRFNQPSARVSNYPKPSILTPLNVGGDLDRSTVVNGTLVTPDEEDDPGIPRALLSDVGWTVKAAEQGNGGLRNAVNAAEEVGVLSDKMWVGTLGMPTDSLKDETRVNISETLEDSYQSITVYVGDNEFEGHYSHFCHTVLWPALHYQMQETPRHTEYYDYSWKQYVKVNEAFAKTIAVYWRPGDSIWVHDYHLLLLPSLLRDMLPEAEIGFFLHTSFPSSEVFRCLNTRSALLDGLLGADLVAFQTDEYCYHFLQSCSRLLGLEVSARGVQLRRRFVHVKSLPIGIDIKAFNKLRQSAEVKDWVANIFSRYKDKHLIIARDKLDTPGGVKHKLLAYELFLKKYPKWREKAVLVQVASGSESTELETQVSKIAIRINSAYSTLTHQALVLLRQDVSYAQFLALMSVAEILMVTSLREGMNLTCHDYLHCQDGKITPQHGGSLILSEFTGSASIFHGHELLVNPWSHKEVADAINKALEMSPEQKHRNWKFLIERKAPYTAVSWCNSLQTALAKAYSTQLARELNQVSSLCVPALEESYETSSLRLFFLEDEGSSSVTSSLSHRLHSLLEHLTLDLKNVVYVTSSKSPEQLESMVKLFPHRIGYIAENGCFRRDIGSSQWKSLIDMEKAQDWKSGICKLIQYYQERIEGTQMEERRCLLTFKYNNARDPEIASRQASDLVDQINGTLGSEAIRVILTEGAIGVEPRDVTKANAAESILELLPRIPDFLFVAGGTRSDEALFRWANRLQSTNTACSVTTLTTGTLPTEAKAVLPRNVNIADILHALCAPPLDGRPSWNSDGPLKEEEASLSRHLIAGC